MSAEQLARNENLAKIALSRLREALSHPCVSGDAHCSDEVLRAVAVEAAEALGKCLLFGGEPEERFGRLPLRLVLAALPAACERFRDLAARAGKLGEFWDEEADQELRDRMCLEALSDRLNAQALYLGLMHSLRQAETRGELDAAKVLDLSEPLTDLLQEYDTRLREQRGVLSTVRAHPQVACWCNALAESYRRALPWWLGPGLDEAAREAQRKVASLVEELFGALGKFPNADSGYHERPLAESGSCPGDESAANRDLRHWAESLHDALAAWCHSFTAGPQAAGQSSAAKGEQRAQQAYPRSLLAGLVAKPGVKQLWLVWHDPSGRYQAQSRVNFPLEDDDKVCLLFVRTADGEEAPELSGTGVLLAGVRSAVNQHAQCVFPVRELREQVSKGARVLLQVARDGRWVTWPPDEAALREVRRAVEGM